MYPEPLSNYFGNCMHSAHGRTCNRSTTVVRDLSSFSKPSGGFLRSRNSVNKKEHGVTMVQSIVVKGGTSILPRLRKLANPLWAKGEDRLVRCV
jgi:hypothetical protein